MTKEELAIAELIEWAARSGYSFAEEAAQAFYEIAGYPHYQDYQGLHIERARKGDSK